MAEGSAVCQDKWVEPEKWKVGVGNAYNSCVIFKTLEEIWSIGQLPPYPRSTFFPSA